jgi:hypothetical protein
MTVSVAEHCRRIKAHIAKGDKAVEKADEHYKAAGIYLKELKAEHADTWAKWEVGSSAGACSALTRAVVTDSGPFMTGGPGLPWVIYGDPFAPGFASS